MFLLPLFFVKVRSFDPNNSKFPDQFYILNTGQNFGAKGEDINIIPAYDSNLSGSEVTIGLYATSCNPDIPALKGRVANSCAKIPNYDDPAVVGDCKPGNHISTRLGSIISGNKGTECCLGIAFNSTLYCKPFVKSINSQVSNDALYKALSSEYDLQIKSFPFTDDCPNKYPKAHSMGIDEYQEVSMSFFFMGRKGLGTIAVFTPTMCNGVGVDPNYRYITQTKYPINIAATDFRGKNAYYSPRSSNFIVNVPSSHSSLYIENENVVTNPIYGANDDGTCDISEGKFPAANAIATGAIALILEKNPSISARTLQLLLELSASINDANHSSWKSNAIGIPYSPLYGFGRLDVDAAIKLMKSSLFDTIQPEIFDASSMMHPYHLIPSCMQEPLVIVHKMKRRINFIETVTVVIITTHHNVGDLNIDLVSPSGTRAPLNDVKPLEDNVRGMNAYVFTARQFLGEVAGGDWQLIISAPSCIPTGRINKTVINVSGMRSFYYNNTKINMTVPEPQITPPSLFSVEDNAEDDTQSISPQLRTSSSEFTELFPKEVRPSNNITYPESEKIAFSYVSYSTFQFNKNYYKLQFNCDQELMDCPAVVYVSSPNIKKPVFPTYFDHARDINNYNIPSPVFGKKTYEYYFTVEIYESPTKVHLKRSPSLISVPNEVIPTQYTVIKRNEEINVPFSLEKFSSNVFVSVTDYDRNILLSKHVEKNNGLVKIKITDPDVKRCVVSISGALSDSCGIFIKTYFVDKKYGENFPLNKSSICQPIEGIVYADPPEDENVNYTKTPSTGNIRTLIPYQSNNQEEGTSNFTTIIVIIVILTVISLVGAIIIVIHCKNAKIRESQEYFEAENELSISSDQNSFVL